MEINLKGFREKALNLSQQEFAEKLEVTQNTVSRWESDPKVLQINKLEEIAKTFGYELADLLSFSVRKINYEPWKTENGTWKLIKRETNRLNKEIDIVQESLSIPMYQDILLYMNYASRKVELLKSIRKNIKKPSVIFTGATDVGKSSMINSLLGDPTLPTKWTPTTSAGTKLVHINDKPKHMESNSTAVFVTESNESLIQTQLLSNKKYFEEHLVVKGGRNIIEDFGTHDGESFKSVRGSRDVVYTIVSYLDAPILEQCEIWDIPGTEASSDENLSDDYTANLAKQGADIVIYLSVSNQFLHNFDMQYLKESVDTLPHINLESKNIEPFANLFIIASQAHIVTDNSESNDIQEVMRKRVEEFGRTLPDEYWDEMIKTVDPNKVHELDYSLEDIQKRAFTFERDRKYLQKDFKKDFLTLLDNISYTKQKQLIDEEESMYKIFDLEIDKETQQLIKYIEDSEKAQNEYDCFIKEFPEYEKRNKELIALMKEKAKFYKKDSHERIEKIYDDMIEVENIRSLVIRKDFGKKKNGKEQFTTWLQNNLNSKVNQVIRKNAELYSKDINDRLEEYEKDSVNMNFTNFNYSASVIGGLSTIATIGAFALYFSTLGNLGGYIFLSQVVSVLSGLGISLGGTATVASAVALIGGPMTLVVGIAVVVGAVVAKLAGGSWQKTFAKNIVKSFNKKYQPKEKSDDKCKGVTYKEILLNGSDSYWQDTLNAINENMFDSELLQRKEELKQQANQNTEELKKSLKAVRNLKFS